MSATIRPHSRGAAAARRALLSLALGLLALAAFAPAARAQARSEYRAFWVDTFNTALNNHTDVLAVVNNAKAAKANAIFAQVRRRGDAWYLNSLEPPPDPSFIKAGFDPLKDLIDTAHESGIEVHAFVIVGAVWNKNPSTAAGRPVHSNHIFARHSGYDPATNSIIPGPNNWLTRTLLPDSAAALIAFQGHRFGNDFWVDLGHPAAAAHTADVLTHLVRNYDIDGLHLDRIRYPEFTATGQTPANGTNIGYNATSVERFKNHHGLPADSPPPVPSDALWKQWRRDQVTNLVRRVYLNAIAIKPHLKISAALIAFGGAPTCPSNTTCATDKEIWEKSASAEAYWRVYQDWRAWTEEGILDIAMPMNYKRENVASNVTFYDTWNEWTKDHQYNRAALVGQGAFLNSVEGTLRQTRRALAPSAAGNSGIGVIFFSMATSNIAVSANPHSIPAGQNTGARSFAEFASGLTTGKSVNGATAYESQSANPVPVFSQAATIPVLSWKAAPTKGHLMGFARRGDGTPLDTAAVTIERVGASETPRATATDGGGFYGGVDLEPGQYLVRAVLGADTVYKCVADVRAGEVTTADLAPETTAPVTTATLDPGAPDGDNGWYTSDVAVTLGATDGCSGVASTEYSLDGGATWQPYAAAFQISEEGATIVTYRSADRAGNVEAAKSLTVRIDKTAPVVHLGANPSTIWPPNGKTVEVTVDGEASDAVSGLAGVSYVVTDEYGATLGIAPRALGGNAASWAESLGVEARREGGDRDGRLYRVTATVRDQAGNTSTATADIVVPHDRSEKEK